MQLNFSKLATAIILGSSLVGCAAVVKTPYQAPAVELPQAFSYNKANSQQILTDAQADQWWTLFGDRQLNQLVDEVLQRNTDLAVSGIALQQARLRAGLAENKQGVRVSSGISTGHSIDLHSGDDASKGVSLSGGVSYEVDLFGKLADIGCDKSHFGTFDASVETGFVTDFFCSLGKGVAKNFHAVTL